MNSEDVGSDSWKRRVAALVPESHKAYLTALRVTGSSALAEEAVQEAYAKLLQHPLKDEGHPQAIAYLLKMVRSRAIDLSRATKNRKEREDEYTVRRPIVPPSPEELTEAAEVAQAARTALSELPREEREAVSLCFEQDLSRKIAAEVLAIPETTLIDRMNRGLEKLRLRLAAQGFASVATLAIGERLRELGVPNAPEALQASVKRICADQRGLVRCKSTRSARRSGAASLGSAVRIFAIACVVAGTVTMVGAYLAPRNKILVSVPVSSTTGAIPVAIPLLAQEKFYHRWTFEKEPPAEILVRDGPWKWNNKTQRMEVDGMVVLQLPGPLPHKAMVVQVKGRCRDSEVGFGTAWSDGAKLLKRRLWQKTDVLNTSSDANYDCKEYIAGSFSFTYRNGSLKSVAEYATPNPGNCLFLILKSVDLESLMFKEVEESELPVDAQRNLTTLLARPEWKRSDVGDESLPPRNTTD